MDAYRANHSVFNFAALSIDALLKRHELKELKSVLVPLATVQRFKQDTRILTMVGSFLDCSGVTSPCLLEETSLDEGTSEGTQQLIGTLLELECSRGRAVGHLLSSVITLDCNVKLVRHSSVLPSLMLPSALATEAYQLPFNPAGSCVFATVCRLS